MAKNQIIKNPYEGRISLCPKKGMVFVLCQNTLSCGITLTCASSNMAPKCTCYVTYICDVTL